MSGSPVTGVIQQKNEYRICSCNVEYATFEVCQTDWLILINMNSLNAFFQFCGILLVNLENRGVA